MAGPFKMSGSQFLGKGNQSKSKHSPLDMDVKGIAGKLGKMGEDPDSPAPFASPAKNTPETKTNIKVNMNDPKVKANYEKYKDNPEYRKALDKKVGGKFNYDEKTNTSTTKKQVKKQVKK
jgi:hypothetical protein